MAIYIQTEPEFKTNSELKSFRFKRLFERLSLTGILAIKALPDNILSALGALGFNLRNRKFAVHLKGYEHPIWLRYKSSDQWAIRKIFIEDEYAPLDDIVSPKLIVDCGANAGYAAIYFLNKYPQAHLIAIEPDSDNVEMCRINLAPFGDRATVIQAGVWSHSTPLKITGKQFGQEWALQVVECGEDEEPDVIATDLTTVLQNSGFPEIDMLKVDIESSEKVVFAKNYEGWIGKIKNLAIEIHDDLDRETVFNAMSSYSYELAYCGELTIYKNITSPT
jgi:FkbM family methyltransferase